MSRLQSLKVFMKQRMTAAVEEIFGHFERTMAEYEEEMNRRHLDLTDAVPTPDAKLRTEADLQPLLVVKEEQQDWSSSLDQEDPEPPHIKEDQQDPEPPHIKEDQEDPEPPHIKEDQEDPEPPHIKEDQQDPEPPHIKEEQEELWTSQEGEQLQGLEEADIKFPFSPVKSEDDEEEAQSSQFHQRQTEQMETEADGEDCGGPEPDENSDPDTDNETEDTSEPETDDSDDWKPHGDQQSGSKSRKRVLDESCYADKHLCICTECGKIFANSTNLKVHKLIHTGLKPFWCRFCSKRFPQQRKLMRHMKRHVPEKTYHCLVCAKCFGSSGDVKRHMGSHAGQTPATS